MTEMVDDHRDASIWANSTNGQIAATSARRLNRLSVISGAASAFSPNAPQIERGASVVDRLRRSCMRST
jgi:hypothetical protein